MISAPPHHRHSIRLKGYDYRQAGAYFLTIVCHQREILLGAIQDEQVCLSPIGQIIEPVWCNLPNRFPHIELDDYVIMPNHFHAILWRTDPPATGAGTSPAPTPPPESNPPANGVGATLVVAPDGSNYHPTGAGTSPAPTPPPESNPPANGVGATLVVAPDGSNYHPTGAGTSPAPTLGDIIGAFKSISTHEIILSVRRHEIPPFHGKIWQRNYFEHIIRNDQELDQIREYIRTNPVHWATDQENPAGGSLG